MRDVKAEKLIDGVICQADIQGDFEDDRFGHFGGIAGKHWH